MCVAKHSALAFVAKNRSRRAVRSSRSMSTSRKHPPHARSRADVLRRLCGNYDAFTQIDFTGEMRADAVGTCIYPQINYLGTLLRYLPRACFVLNTRPTAHWLNSVSQWAGLMPRILRNCPIWPRNETGLARWSVWKSTSASGAPMRSCPPNRAARDHAATPSSRRRVDGEVI